MHIGTGGICTAINCDFISNTGYTGGGLYVSSGTSIIDIFGTSFSENTARYSSSYADIYIGGGTVTIHSDCELADYKPDKPSSGSSIVVSGSYSGTAKSFGNCKVCASGKAIHQLNSSVCDVVETCPSGTGNEVKIASSHYRSHGGCFDCIAGRYSPSGNSTCFSCYAGKYSTTGASSSSSCLSCEKGKYSSNAGTPVCSPCDGGKYASTIGAISCSNCIAGKFSTSTGANSSSVCIACDIVKFSVTFGATSCSSTIRKTTSDFKIGYDSLTHGDTLTLIPDTEYSGVHQTYPSRGPVKLSDTYTYNFDNSASMINLSPAKGINIFCESSAFDKTDRCVFDAGSNTRRVFYIDSVPADQSIWFYGLIIKNGKSSSVGGGVSISNSKSIFESVLFQNNVVSDIITKSGPVISLEQHLKQHTPFWYLSSRQNKCKTKSSKKIMIVDN